MYTTLLASSTGYFFVSWKRMGNNLMNLKQNEGLGERLGQITMERKRMEPFGNKYLQSSVQNARVRE